jgi:hypothetical protein
MSDESRREEHLDRLREAVDDKSEEARARAAGGLGRRPNKRGRTPSGRQAREDSLTSSERQPEQMSVRAKSSGHRKKSADKWNQ